MNVEKKSLMSIEVTEGNVLQLKFESYYFEEGVRKDETRTLHRTAITPDAQDKDIPEFLAMVAENGKLFLDVKAAAKKITSIRHALAKE